MFRSLGLSAEAIVFGSLVSLDSASSVRRARLTAVNSLSVLMTEQCSCELENRLRNDAWPGLQSSDSSLSGMLVAAVVNDKVPN